MRLTSRASVLFICVLLSPEKRVAKTYRITSVRRGLSTADQRASVLLTTAPSQTVINSEVVDLSWSEGDVGCVPDRARLASGARLVCGLSSGQSNECGTGDDGEQHGFGLFGEYEMMLI